MAIRYVVAATLISLCACVEENVETPADAVRKIQFADSSRVTQSSYIFASNLDGGSPCMIKSDRRLLIDALLDVVHEGKYQSGIGSVERFQFDPSGNFKCRSGVPFSGPGRLRAAGSLKRNGSTDWAHPRYLEYSTFWLDGEAQGFAHIKSQTLPFGKSGLMNREDATVFVPENENASLRRAQPGERNKYFDQVGTESDFFDYLLAVRQSSVPEFTQGLTRQFDIATDLVPGKRSDMKIGGSSLGANNQFIGAKLRYHIKPKKVEGLPGLIKAKAVFRVVFSYELAGFAGLAGRNKTETLEVPVILSKQNGYTTSGELLLSDVITIQDASLGLISYRQLLDGFSIISSLQPIGE